MLLNTVIRSSVWMRILSRRGRRGSVLLASQRMGQEIPCQRRSRGEPVVEIEEAALREKEGCEDVQRVCGVNSNRSWARAVS